MVRCTAMRWRAASSGKPKARCTSPSPPCIPCCTAWSGAAGFAAIGKLATMAAAAAAIASLRPGGKNFRRSARNGRNCSKHCVGSRRWPMPDWQAPGRAQLDGLALEPRERAEVIEELASHLIETFEGLRRQGFTEEEDRKSTRLNSSHT